MIRELVEADVRGLRDPEPMDFVESLDDSSVNIGVRVGTKSADSWGVTFDLQESIKKRFDAEGISIPCPQQELAIRQGSLPS